MKLPALILLLFIPAGSYCQAQEMDIYEGLMYSAADMQHLKRTVDSLNLKFLQCTSTPEYYSLPQAKASYVEFKVEKANDAGSIRAMLDEGRSFDEVWGRFTGI